MTTVNYMRLVRAADENGWEICAFVEVPPADGTYPAAWCIVRRIGKDRGEYVVTMGVMPPDDPAHFVWSTYDLTYAKAVRILGEKAVRDAPEREEVTT